MSTTSSTPTSSTHPSSPVTRFATLLGLGGLAVVGATACSLSFSLGTEGSGVPETVTYDFESFDQVDVSGAFEAEITVADGPFSVEITVDDNLVDKLEVDVDGDELNVGFDGWDNIDHNVDPVVVITMPSLSGLDLSGASSAVVDGVDGSTLEVDMSGASDVTIDGSVESLNIDGSGASLVSLNGSVEQANVELSGASSADFTNATVDVANIDLSGSSGAEFDEIDELRGELSGASSASVPDETTVIVNTSGASSVDQG